MAGAKLEICICSRRNITICRKQPTFCTPSGMAIVHLFCSHGLGSCSDCDSDNEDGMASLWNTPWSHRNYFIKNSSRHPKMVNVIYWTFFFLSLLFNCIGSQLNERNALQADTIKIQTRIFLLFVCEKFCRRWVISPDERFASSAQICNTNIEAELTFNKLSDEWFVYVIVIWSNWHFERAIKHSFANNHSSATCAIGAWKS